jgi:Cu+-exporting ATPase
MRNPREHERRPAHGRGWLLIAWGAAGLAAVPPALRAFGLADSAAWLHGELLLGAAAAAVAGYTALRYVFRYRPWWSHHAPALPTLLAGLMLLFTAPAAIRDGGISLAWAAPLVLTVHATGLHLLSGGRPRALRALHDHTVHMVVPLVALWAGGACAFLLFSGHPAGFALTTGAAVLLAVNPRLFAAGRLLALREGMNRATALGLHFRRRAVLDELYAPATVALLPEGTLTTGRPRVRETIPAPGHSAAELLAIALAGARLAGLPEAGGLETEAARRGCEERSAGETRTYEGLGIAFECGGEPVLLGSPRLLHERGVDLAPLEGTLRRARSEGRRLLLAARDGALLGGVLMDDPFRPDAVRTVRLLRKLGRRVAAITARAPEDFAVTAEQAAIPRLIGGVPPSECVHALDELRSETIHRVILVSPDPDSPALDAADLGIVMHPEAEPVPARIHLALRSPNAAGLGHAFLLARAVRTARLRAHAWAATCGLLLPAAAMAGILHPVAAAICAQAAWVPLIINARRLRRFDPDRAARAVMDQPDYIKPD